MVINIFETVDLRTSRSFTLFETYRELFDHGMLLLMCGTCYERTRCKHCKLF